MRHSDTGAASGAANASRFAPQKTEASDQAESRFEPFLDRSSQIKADQRADLIGLASALYRGA
jgi:hypothetical protein